MKPRNAFKKKNTQHLMDGQRQRDEMRISRELLARWMSQANRRGRDIGGLKVGWVADWGSKGTEFGLGGQRVGSLV